MPSASGIDRIRQMVIAHLPEADADTLTLVTAITGLLASVTYADREVREAERAQLRAILGRVQGLPLAGADAICDLLATHAAEIAAQGPQRHTRALRETADVELRLEVLDMLLDLAAADHELSMAETDWLRRTATALGLSQDDYVAAQARHRQHLSVLKR